jgi:hypothetical protein
VSAAPIATETTLLELSAFRIAQWVERLRFDGGPVRDAAVRVLACDCDSAVDRRPPRTEDVRVLLEFGQMVRAAGESAASVEGGG